MSADQIGNPLIEPLCYLSMAGLTAATYLTDKIPLHLNICVFSLAIITVGSYRSLREMISEIKKVQLLGKKSEGIETVTSKEALQFPLLAGGMLLGLYLLIKFFGKDSVNYFVLAYIALGSATGIKALLTSFFPQLEGLDEAKVLSVKNRLFEAEISLLDVGCFLLSVVAVALYTLSKSWVYNNIIAIVFCVHALQFIFLGNFRTGVLLLSLLFFYDIFFVFGTDVMVTVAKNIDAPIKLQFPRDLAADPPQYSILGLGDIVIPGIFVSLCLRFDFLKALNLERLNDLIERERSGKADNNSVVKYLIGAANSASKRYFAAVVVGYLVAILTTVVVMIVFEHGQPALLYLVPGCILSVFLLAAAQGEFALMWNHDESKFISSEKKDQ